MVIMLGTSMNRLLNFQKSIFFFCIILFSKNVIPRSTEAERHTSAPSSSSQVRAEWVSCTSRCVKCTRNNQQRATNQSTQLHLGSKRACGFILVFMATQVLRQYEQLEGSHFLLTFPPNQCTLHDMTKLAPGSEWAKKNHNVNPLRGPQYGAEICDTIPELFHTQVESKSLQGDKVLVQKSLKSALRVAITCDAWTSRATVSYVTVTAHHVNSQWKLTSYVLQTRAMDDSHTGTNMCDSATDCFFLNSVVYFGLLLSDGKSIIENR